MGEVLERGRMYERYREKREAKLREEWFLKMGEKEAEMRAMWDRFDRARTLSSCQETSRLSDVRSDSRTRQRVGLHHFFLRVSCYEVMRLIQILCTMLIA